MALDQAAQAHGQTDPTEVRRAWDSTLYYLDLADQYQVTQDSLNLRQEAQTALDNLDGIVRLDFRPAIVTEVEPHCADQPDGCHQHRLVPARRFTRERDARRPGKPGI